MANSVDPDEAAHEPSRLDLRCLQIHLYLRVKHILLSLLNKPMY